MRSTGPRPPATAIATTARTAEDVRRNFEDDLASDAAQEVQRELRTLDLPTLRAVKPEFDQLCNRLGIGSERPGQAKEEKDAAA